MFTKTQQELFVMMHGIYMSLKLPALNFMVILQLFLTLKETIAIMMSFG
jgi:hypothetical protein